MKFGRHSIIHLGYLAQSKFEEKNSRMPFSYFIDDFREIVDIAKDLLKDEKLKDLINFEEDKEEIIKILAMMSMTHDGQFGPQDAYLGGIIAQETIKAITGKFMPIQQTMYADCTEVLTQELFSAKWMNEPEQKTVTKIEEKPEQKPGDIINEKKEEKKVYTLYDANEKDFAVEINKLGLVSENMKHRNIGLQKLVGFELQTRIRKSELFMVGSGAIGCELLKNYAMLGVGAEGQLILTDPDIIEVSNLSRQFLFREKHLRQPKSQTAAAAAQQMNPELKGKIIARLDRLDENTEHIYTDKFFKDLTIVTNALDNVRARRYVDQRCTKSRTALIESGTLGPKGHVQVIIPLVTETYASLDDPEDEVQIPHCTLKMFPEETLHCVEWARDKFSKIFTIRPKALSKCLDDCAANKLDIGELRALKEANSYADKAPKNYMDCLKYARNKFEKYFNHDIRLLLYAYPLDKMTKEGRMFWSLPKRPPTYIEFSKENQVHVDFIISFACLRANIYSIQLPKDIREKSVKLEYIDQVIKDIKVKEYKLKEDKIGAILKEVEKDDDKEVTE